MALQVLLISIVVVVVWGCNLISITVLNRKMPRAQVSWCLLAGAAFIALPAFALLIIPEKRAEMNLSAGLTTALGQALNNLGVPIMMKLGERGQASTLGPASNLYMIYPVMGGYLLFGDTLAPLILSAAVLMIFCTIGLGFSSVPHAKVEVEDEENGLSQVTAVGDSNKTSNGIEIGKDMLSSIDTSTFEQSSTDYESGTPTTSIDGSSGEEIGAVQAQSLTILTPAQQVSENIP